VARDGCARAPVGSLLAPTRPVHERAERPALRMWLARPMSEPIFQVELSSTGVSRSAERRSPSRIRRANDVPESLLAKWHRVRYLCRLISAETPPRCLDSR
jgi:hypothetical protein